MEGSGCDILSRIIQRLAGGTEKNQEKSLSVQPIPGPRFKPGTHQDEAGVLTTLPRRLVFIRTSCYVCNGRSFAQESCNLIYLRVVEGTNVRL
jgi:hypothetical protein